MIKSGLFFELENVENVGDSRIIRAEEMPAPKKLYWAECEDDGEVFRDDYVTHYLSKEDIAEAIKISNREGGRPFCPETGKCAGCCAVEECDFAQKNESEAIKNLRELVRGL